METLTAKTVQMKILPFVTDGHVIQKQNLHARTDAAFKSFGCATLITTVVMILTNLLTCAGKEIVLRVGNVVQAEPITGAFQNGCSVTEKMIVGTTQMNLKKIVQNATLILISNVPTTVACQSNGNVTSQTIVVMALMKLKPYAKETIGNVQSLNLDVIMASVFRQDGGVIMKMTVVTTLMKLDAPISSVRMEHSSARLDTALQHISGKSKTKQNHSSGTNSSATLIIL